MTQKSPSIGTQESDIDFNDMFSLRKPKDARAGLSSGMKSVGKGILAGAVGLVAAPAIGAHQEGFVGFAKGAAAGIAGAVLLPATGVVVGVTQAVRGIAATPTALKEQANGKFWDENTRSWQDTPSQALSVNVAPQPEPWEQPSTSGGDGADFYALLGVSRTAAPEEIRKSYYILARKMHPDKNPDDPEANEKFQRLGEAYQVLGNPELRARYDAHGEQGLDVNFVDGAEFFTALFGSDRFDHLVGELMMTAAARAGGDLTAQQLKAMQEEREAELAVMLVAILMRWTEGDEEGFIDAMKAEAKDLAAASFGQVMLHAVGRVYKVQATIYLGNLVDSSITALKAKGRSIKAQFQAASMAIKVYQTQQQLNRLEVAAEKAKELAQEQQSGESDTDNTTVTAAGHPNGSEAESAKELKSAAAAMAAERAQLEEQSLPLMLDAMWAANVLDIESTVRHVCKRVLNDPQVGKEQRKSRAQGLLQLGRIFLDAKAPTSSESTKTKTSNDQAKAQMEAAMMRVLEKRMQADDKAHA